MSESTKVDVRRLAAEHTLLRETLVALYNATRWAHTGDAKTNSVAERAAAVLDEVKPVGSR